MSEDYRPGDDRAEGRTFVFFGILLLAVFLYAASLLTAPTSAPPPAKPPAIAYRDYVDNGALASYHIDNLALQTKGNFNLIASDDKQWLQQMTQGHGAELISGRYKFLQSHPAALRKAKGPPPPIGKM